MLLGVDVGGTFTDAVLADGERVFTGKSPTTPADQSEGVMNAVAAVLEQAGEAAEAVERFAHGMTVATNALLEGDGARTALIATEGFADLIALRRQARPELYRLCVAGPPPLTPPERRFEAPERMGPDGALREFTDEAARALIGEVSASEPEAVAVVLLHAYRHPAHEQRLGELLTEALGGVHVSLSHAVVGTFREYERAATTEIDASLSPLLAGYLRRLASRCEEQRLPVPAIMHSGGGLIDAAEAAAGAVRTVLSGPAAGAAGAAFIARRAGVRHGLCLDMGGTSCDVCVVENGRVAEQASGEIAGRPIALPMLAVHTVGAGGGSIAWADPGGALRVGPRSSGADPGPACYGRGGSEPTVTDANLLLGRISEEHPLAGGVRLQRDAAEQAVAALAERLGMSESDCAEGIIAVANAEMIRALRVVTVERGIDPREHTLLAFGGAGPLHAAEIAERLDIDRVICPRNSGVLAALGLLVSPPRRDLQRTVMLSGENLSEPEVAGHTRDLREEARAGWGSEAEPAFRTTYALRYRGQSHELAIDGAPEPDLAELREAFEAEHRDRYGYHDPDGALELVTIRLAAALSGVELEAVAAAADSPGETADGPARIELPESTVWVPPGWRAEHDEHGDVALERAR